ncbi:hypothetical protein M433DRAFT_159641 [Acidomyces richmondensis BFW]|nr:hypothetical protein M433DRAFT_159641 [Acidomyces richmondensis BFW]
MLFLSLACGQNIEISAGNVKINELTNNIQVFVTYEPQCQFYPPYVKTNVNDLVTFTFTNPNITITESSFAEPCQPQENTLQASILQPYTSNLVMKVPDGIPRWFFIGSPSEATNCSANCVFAIKPGPAGIAFFQKSTLNSQLFAHCYIDLINISCSDIIIYTAE